MKVDALILLAFCMSGLGACAGDPVDVDNPPNPPDPPNPAISVDATVTVQGNELHQVIDGFGTTERLFDDPHVTETWNPATQRAAVVVPATEQAAILKALYTDLGLTRARYNPRDGGPGSGLEDTNDNADPRSTDLSKFDFSWKKNDGHIDYVRNAQPWGLTTFFASPLTLESFMTEANPEEYVEWAMAILRRWRDAGVEMPYYSILNEPGFTRGGIWSGAYIRDVVKLLGAQLAAEGFSTKLVVPDDFDASQALSRLQVVLADPVARQYVGAVAYHLYSTAGRSEVQALAAQYGIPVWMTEYYVGDWFSWASIMHELLADYGVSAIDYQWGFFGQWERARGSYLIEINHSGDAYTGFSLTKRYYAMGQYSRFVRPGARRLGTTVSDSSVKATAYRNGSTTVVVVVNEGGGQTVGIEVGVSGSPATATAVMTDQSNDWRALTVTAGSPGQFVVSVPSRSVTTVEIR